MKTSTRLKVHESKERLIKDGAPFFLLADTVWDAFSNATLPEWEEYLFLRRQQQFNALQMSVLPVLTLYDPNGAYTGLYPFHRDSDGAWDFHRIDDTYFDNAETKVRMASDNGFVPVLVLMWSNYVPGTWQNDQTPAFTMPKDAIKSFAEYVAGRFKLYHPIYFISGDTLFETEQVTDHFHLALETIKAADPDALTAMHVGGVILEIPERIASSSSLDLYIYQAGHSMDGFTHQSGLVELGQKGNYKLAELYRNKPIKRPIFNSEPCYEGYLHKYGLFEALDMRKAFWWSVLSGAKAGFAYGAHGIFSWHRLGAEWAPEKFNLSIMPFDWKTALQFQGAWDVSYSKWLFEQYGLQELEPGNGHLLTPADGIRMAVMPDLSKFALYLPCSRDAAVDLDLRGYRVEQIALADRQVIRPAISSDQEGVSMIRRLEKNSDSLVIGFRTLHSHISN